MSRPLPITEINDLALKLLAQAAVGLWKNPPNPALAFLYDRLVALEGFTPFSKNLPIATDVLHVPVAAAFASPRATLPTIGGDARKVSVVNSFEMQVPLTGATIDEWEETNQLSSIMGIGATSSAEAFAEQQMAGRMDFGLQAMRNRLEVMTLDMIVNARVSVTGEYTNPVSNLFTRNTATTVAQLSSPDYSVADLTAGSLTDRRWVNADGTSNTTTATPVEDVQVMISASKRFGGGGASAFVMSAEALKSYQEDFAVNYADVSNRQIMTMGGNAAYELPSALLQIGWSLLGYVHDRSNNWALVPVYGGDSIQYRDWTDDVTKNDFLPSYNFVFPLPKTPIISQRFTYVDVFKLADIKTLFPVNLYEDKKQGTTEGELLHRGYLYPRVNPNALVFWKV